jgi:hypothetical protein
MIPRRVSQAVNAISRALDQGGEGSGGVAIKRARLRKSRLRRLLSGRSTPVGRD